MGEAAHQKGKGSDQILITSDNRCCQQAWEKKLCRFYQHSSPTSLPSVSLPGINVYELHWNHIENKLYPFWWSTDIPSSSFFLQGVQSFCVFRERLTVLKSILPCWWWKNGSSTFELMKSRCRNALQHSFLTNAPLIPPPSCGGETRLSGNFKVVEEGVGMRKI